MKYTFTAGKVSKYGDFLVRIFPYSDWIKRFTRKSPYSVQIRENKDQKISVFRHFSRSVYFSNTQILYLKIYSLLVVKFWIILYFPNTQIFFLKIYSLPTQDLGLYKKIIQYRYFVMNFAKIFRTLFLQNIFEWLFLQIPYHFKLFKGCLPQVLLGPFLNTLTHKILEFYLFGKFSFVDYTHQFIHLFSP